MIHKDTKVDLFPTTVFVGPNNGGKSALFDALLNFSMVSRGRLSQAFGPGPWSFRSLRNRQTRNARVGYTVTMTESAEATEFLTYRISYSQQQQQGIGDAQRYTIYDETLTDANGEKLFSRSDELQLGDGSEEFVSDDISIFAAIRHSQTKGSYKEVHPLISHCAAGISRINKFRLDPKTLAHPSLLPDTTTSESDGRIPRLDYSGEGLATVLYYLSETANPLLDSLVERLAGVIDGFEGFEFNTVGTNSIGFSARFGDSRGSVNAANLSAGTLSLIGLLLMLLSPDRPPILCLEEPENGLTPRATKAVYDAIVEATRNEEGTQVLISSHSPFVICEAWNGTERDFIYQVRPEAGQALVRPFAEVISREQIQLGKVRGKREHLSLTVASEVMAGYYS